MIDNSLIYHNPLIPPNFYYAKIVHIETEKAAFYYPKILVQLLIRPSDILPQEKTLVSIIHPTNNSRKHYDNFIETFLGYHDKDVTCALGRWGSIWVYDAEYQETKYSAVKYVYQPLWLKLSIMQIYEQETTDLSIL
jgi:hypothetical protein